MNTKYWNSLADRFDEEVLEISTRDFRGVLREEIDRLARGASSTADLGCGAGSLLGLLAKRFKIVFAVDFADSLLEQARRRNSSPNITFIRHNLSGNRPLNVKTDVTFCVNALISPSIDLRRQFARNIWQATRPNGFGLFVVPAFESSVNTYHAIIRCRERQGESRSRVTNEMNQVFRRQVEHPIGGLIRVGGTLTKCFMKEEIEVFLSDAGFSIERIRKIEYPWNEEIDHAPRWLQSPYPWDWLVVARRKRR